MAFHPMKVPKCLASFLLNQLYIRSQVDGCLQFVNRNISPYLVDISSGNVRVKMSARFNRVSGDDQIDTQFTIQIYAFEGDCTSLNDQYMGLQTNLAYATQDISSDNDITTWELAEVEFVLPANTDFVAMFVHAKENVFNDPGSGEFDGHYVDAVTFELIPELHLLL